jgi:hypothetical protein
VILELTPRHSFLWIGKKAAHKELSYIGEKIVITLFLLKDSGHRRRYQIILRIVNESMRNPSKEYLMK